MEDRPSVRIWFPRGHDGATHPPAGFKSAPPPTLSTQVHYIVMFKFLALIGFVALALAHPRE